MVANFTNTDWVVSYFASLLVLYHSFLHPSNRQVAFWNLIGAIGFMLCGALGYASESSGAEYQSALSTYWGSWAFLIGSIAQIVEAVWRE
jgi:hypothetical protein